MSSSDYLPSEEAKFYLWAKNMVTIVGNSASAWQIPVAATNQFIQSFSVYEDKYLIASNQQTRTKIAVQGKNAARKQFTSVLRQFCKSHLLYNELLTVEDRATLELPLRDTGGSRIPPPHTSPVGRVDTSVHLRHLIRVVDSEEIRPRHGLPDGVHGFEAWRKIGGEPPATEAEFSFLNFSSTWTLTATYPIEQAGMTVWYRFRWVNARNEPGPWSESIISAIIA
jgi:hypothetical protein